MQPLPSVQDDSQQNTDDDDQKDVDREKGDKSKRGNRDHSGDPAGFLPDGSRKAPDGITDNRGDACLHSEQDITDRVER